MIGAADRARSHAERTDIKRGAFEGKPNVKRISKVKSQWCQGLAPRGFAQLNFVKWACLASLSEVRARGAEAERSFSTARPLTRETGREASLPLTPSAQWSRGSFEAAR